MSGISSRTGTRSGSSRITDNQILKLVSRLRQLLLEIHERRFEKASTSKVLQDTCNYIRNLHKEVGDLSERLSQPLSTLDEDSPEASIIRNLIP